MALALLAPSVPPLPIKVLRTYQASAELQEVELVLRYSGLPDLDVTRACMETFVELAGQGFFADDGLPPELASAALVQDVSATMGERAPGSAPVEAWSLKVSCVSPRAFDWLVAALQRAGAPVVRCSVLGENEEELWGRAVNTVTPFPVRARRSGRGFALHVVFAENVTDELEQAFRSLLSQWTTFASVLPSRNGHAVPRMTRKPSFERGSDILGAAGRDLDVAASDVEGPLLAALARFHHTVSPIRYVAIELG